MALDETVRAEARRLLNEHAKATAAKAATFASAISGTQVAGAASIASTIRGYADRIFTAVETLASARVGGATLRLEGVQPIPRVDVHIVVLGRKRRLRTSPGDMLRDVFAVVYGKEPDRSMSEAMAAMEPALATALALVRADALNAVQKALKDEELVGKVRGRIDKKRAAARHAAHESVRQQFKGFREILTEDDIVAIWREVVVGEVMES